MRQCQKKAETKVSKKNEMSKNYKKIHDTSKVTVPHITRANVKFICIPFDNKLFGIHK